MLGADMGNREYLKEKARVEDEAEGPPPTTMHTLLNATRLLIIVIAAQPGVYMLLDAAYFAPMDPRTSRIIYSDGTYGPDRYFTAAEYVGMSRRALLALLGLWLIVTTTVVWFSTRLRTVAITALVLTYIGDSAVRYALDDDFIKPLIAVAVCMAHYATIVLNAPGAAVPAPPAAPAVTAEKKKE